MSGNGNAQHPVTKTKHPFKTHLLSRTQTHPQPTNQPRRSRAGIRGTQSEPVRTSTSSAVRRRLPWPPAVPTSTAVDEVTCSPPAKYSARASGLHYLVEAPPTPTGHSTTWLSFLLSVASCPPDRSASSNRILHRALFAIRWSVVFIGYR